MPDDAAHNKDSDRTEKQSARNPANAAKVWGLTVNKSLKTGGAIAQQQSLTRWRMMRKRAPHPELKAA